MMIITVIQFCLNVFIRRPSLSSQRLPVSPCVAVHCQPIYVSACADEDKKNRGFITRSLLRPCARCQYSVCCVCAMSEIHSSPAVSVASHVSWFWFWTRGADRRLVTPGNLRSAILLQVQVFASFSHQGTGEEPGQRVFLLPNVYLPF